MSSSIATASENANDIETEISNGAEKADNTDYGESEHDHEVANNSDRHSGNLDFFRPADAT